ncbi:major capsid protein [Phytoactinopolyspora mesophila]|uniref:Major capsid protein n=1 Tax=Phytoactinopolyspora mesophila TaxID=2650750 RepID=A0A7K3M5N7_9ACTN|nr:major capsid protein [Phytoactinopolyspora mesophila]NDL58634.1 major capsid protein [Phytoactinopolyspora mesophila]
MSFEIPTDLSALTDEDLSQALTDATEEFNSKVAETNVDDAHLSRLTALADFADAARAEQGKRVELAESTADQIAKLSDRFHGKAATAPADDAGDDEPGDADADADGDDVTASAGAVERRPRINIAPALKNRPLTVANRGVEFTASSSVNGFAPNQALGLDSLSQAIHTAARSVRTGGKSSHKILAATYALPFASDLISSGPDVTEGTELVRHAASQSRLPQKDLVASGGWCSPSETIYDIQQIACADMQWNLPEIQLTRGGLQFFKPVPLDASELVFVHTETADIAGSEKPCYHIPCPDPEHVRCDAVGVCLESGILSDKFFPERINYYRELAMVAHELRLRKLLFDQAVSEATIVELPQTFGAFSAFFNAVALQVSDYTERYSLCDSIGVEIVAPWWLRNQMLADIARRNGVSIDEVNPAVITQAFARLGVAIQFAKGLYVGDISPLGRDEPATEWPGGVDVLMYAAGSLQLGRGEEIELGVIYDSEKLKTNDHTALFSEECVALVDRSPEVRLLRVPVCADGVTGGQTILDCPAPDFESIGAES